MTRLWLWGLLGLVLAALISGATVWMQRAAPDILRLGSTTSTKDSGLLDHLLPLYEAEAGIKVLVIAKGTGAAIRDGRAGLVDALLVHNQTLEQSLVADGTALSRRAIMSNNFWLVGPEPPMGCTDIEAFLAAAVRGERGLFLTRGDQSGTHSAEQAMWRHFGYNPETFGDWYVKTGTGMGQTLLTANAVGAATLTDSATWAKHEGTSALDIKVCSTGQEQTVLANPYGYLTLNPEVVPGVRADLAEDFGTWLAGPAGQGAIETYLINGLRAFEPAEANTYRSIREVIQNRE